VKTDNDVDGGRRRKRWSAVEHTTTDIVQLSSKPLRSLIAVVGFTVEINSHYSFLRSFHSFIHSCFYPVAVSFFLTPSQRIHDIRRYVLTEDAAHTPNSCLRCALERFLQRYSFLHSLFSRRSSWTKIPAGAFCRLLGFRHVRTG